MIRQPISKKSECILMVLSIICVVGFYAFLSYQQHSLNPRDTTIPNIYQFIDGWKILLHPDSQGNVWLIRDSLATGGRLLLGLSAGISLSFLVGVGMGVYAPLEYFLILPVSFLGKIPATAMLAVYFTIFGTNLEMFIAMISFGILPALSLSIYNAVKTDVSEHAIHIGYTLGASNFEVIWEIVVRQILPRIIDNIRLCTGPALVFLIAAEWFVAQEGFGYTLKLQSKIGNMNIVYTYLIILGIFGFAADNFLLFLRRKVCPWFELNR